MKSLQPLRCYVKGCGQLGINCNKSNSIVCSYHHSLTSSSIQNIPTRVSSFTNKHRVIKGINLPISNGKISELTRRIKIKGNSIGDTSISQSNRPSIALIIKANVQSLIIRDTPLPFCIWIDKTKTVGWNLDYIVRYLEISRLSDGSNTTHKYTFNLIQDEVNLAPIPLCCTYNTLIKSRDTLCLT
ncbi:uncharacterized protein CMU_026270 [Cryptosporidium muris RN66]|uniref:Uncharacterized protein n=1 Tax=Cryptosporidium muris (strain RN66) TaxID=441375 RepID=B6AB68_CRYMR|nr:uncharacterized protein CMU_026270 [Cryptosporidium muris RN66]EEA05620.1 hypothetical protein, conserved [Cryptosporidium muris RN66]|eukprot:XP_002139969.1 hypothetical protein [Cryptosporidium muris RN66]